MMFNCPFGVAGRIGLMGSPVRIAFRLFGDLMLVSFGVAYSVGLLGGILHTPRIESSSRH